MLYKQVLYIPLFFPTMHINNRFDENGWAISWNAVIFTFHHYHSVKPEVLGIDFGKARVQPGNDDGPVATLEKAMYW
ncbi:hypothetical protein [Mucilaginibacter sp.]|uniref:hypothetical protein n=1 Tax=Mucilaginibacter sp. TaxID=1882438 RepID=UPI002ED59429